MDDSKSLYRKWLEITKHPSIDPFWKDGSYQGHHVIPKSSTVPTIHVTSWSNDSMDFWGSNVKGGIGIIQPPNEGKDYKWYISGIFPANWVIKNPPIPPFEWWDLSKAVRKIFGKGSGKICWSSIAVGWPNELQNLNLFHLRSLRVPAQCHAPRK